MKKISKLCLTLFLLFCCVLSFGQNGKSGIRLQVINDQKQAVESATVELLRARDSGLVRSALTDANGWALIEGISQGAYLVRTTVVGFEPSMLTATVEGAELQLTPIQLKPKVQNQMQGVTVTAKKPFIQKLSDRIVVNVEGSIVSAGASALEVLERAPGVTVDQNDAIALRGRAGVIIMIDGKPTPMTGTELANYLKGLPSNAIERIDIITNPSSKYDASGNSGIIDIRMKKDQRLGYNGTLNAGYGQGIYPKANAGSNFNYRNKAMNIFGNYNYSYRESMNHLFINRNFYENGVLKGSDNKDNFAWMPSHSHNARLGADFFPSKNTIIGFVVSSNFNRFRRYADINTIVNDLQFNPDFRFLSAGTNNDRFSNMVGNINFKQKLGSKGSEITADIDYGEYRSRSLTRTASYFYNLDNSKRKEDEILDGDQEGKLTLKTAKVDYTLPLKAGSRFEAGAKTSYVQSDNDAQFFNVFPSYTEVDQTKTNRFYYQEYNNAAYLNYAKGLGKWDFQLGLRGEHTSVRTRQVKGDRRFSNDYFQLFPTAFLNYKLKEDQTIGASLSRRIDRPGYSQLNPFLFQIDATIYSTGEPLLRPQTTWSYELNYTVRNMNFTLGYSKTLNPHNMVLSKILDVIPTFEIKPGADSNITVQIPVNLESQDYFGLTATVPVKVTRWWNMMNNLNVFYNYFNGNLGGTVLSNGTPAANIRINNSFTFNKGWSAEMNGSLNTGGRSGYMVMQPTWGIALGVQKQVFEGKGTIRLNVSDIFWTNLPRGKVTYEGSYIENWNAERDTRVANLSFTYRFGSNKVQAARKRTTASEEERQRAGQ